MSKKNKLNKAQIKEKVEIFFQKAHDVFKKDKKLANKYVHKARKLTMKVRMRLAPDLKRKFCKYCHSYLMPGENLRVRTQHGKLVYYCYECKHHWRMPYIAEKKAKQALSLQSNNNRKI
jgi:ribonuclease P protein subunit RPR2